MCSKLLSGNWEYDAQVAVAAIACVVLFMETPVPIGSVRTRSEGIFIQGLIQAGLSQKISLDELICVPRTQGKS